jgi:hypothetical protein
MKLTDAITALEKHTDDLASGSYLAHAFFMDDGKEEWQIGFVDPEDESITVFVVSNDAVTKNPPAEAFKKPDHSIEELKLENVKISAEKALDSAKNHLSDKHPTHPLKQSIVLLQVLPEFGQVYNITLVTETFHMYNVKIESDSGKVVGEKFDHLMSLRKD